MKHESDITNNFCVMYALLNLHFPFIYTVARLQEKWGVLPIPSKSFKEGRKNYDIFLKHLQIGNWSKYHEFHRDIKKLLYIAGFSENWSVSFGIYVVTDKIVPPSIKDPKHRETEIVVAEIYALALGILKKVQKAQKRVGSSKLSLPKGMPRIEGDTNVADIIFGKVDWDKVTDQELIDLETKRINLVKKHRERVKDSPYYVKIPPKTRKFIDNLLDTPLMN